MPGGTHLTGEADAPAIELQAVDIVFAGSPRRRRQALGLLDQGRTRAEIQAETGCVVGAAGVSLSVAPGSICVLMGLSGSGKSTLLRAVNGLIPPSRGAVRVRHRGGRVDVGACGASELRTLRRHGVAMVFQGFGLLPWRTVAQNVALGLELRGAGRAEVARQVAAKLDLVGMSAWAGRPVQELSGGMQQRVGLARALATDADILLMDEPFSALDPLTRRQMQAELLALQGQLGRTILFVSHDMEEALTLGGRIAILRDGRLVQAGTAEQIVTAPADDHVAAFVRPMNPLAMSPLAVNPLAVLRARSAMRPVADMATKDDALLLDPAGRLRLRLDAEGRPATAVLDGHAIAVGTSDGAIRTALLDLGLRDVLALRHASGHPVLLVDEAGRLHGLCGDVEIHAALLGDRNPA